MTDNEVSGADLWATGVAPDGHPTRFVRPALDALGVVPASGLREVDDGSKVLVGGVVTHRQRPATASGITFINLEDETGLINVICSRGCWTRYRRVARGSAAILVRGRLEKVEGVINIVAEKLEPLPLGATPAPRFPWPRVACSTVAACCTPTFGLADIYNLRASTPPCCPRILGITMIAHGYNTSGAAADRRHRRSSRAWA
jgi:hypothetical protein